MPRSLHRPVELTQSLLTEFCSKPRGPRGANGLWWPWPGSSAAANASSGQPCSGRRSVHRADGRHRLDRPGHDGHSVEARLPQRLADEPAGRCSGWASTIGPTSRRPIRLSSSPPRRGRQRFCPGGGHPHVAAGRSFTLLPCKRRPVQPPSRPRCGRQATRSPPSTATPNIRRSSWRLAHQAGRRRTLVRAAAADWPGRGSLAPATSRTAGWSRGRGPTRGLR